MASCCYLLPLAIFVARFICASCLWIDNILCVPLAMPFPPDFSIIVLRSCIAASCIGWSCKRRRHRNDSVKYCAPLRNGANANEKTANHSHIHENGSSAIRNKHTHSQTLYRMKYSTLSISLAFSRTQLERAKQSGHPSESSS